VRGSFGSRVIGDEMRLFRVLTNLLDNALRHSPTGATVVVTARCEDGTIWLSVDDEGPGVLPELVPHLFEKFSRGRDPAAGTGLGLFYCRITLEDWGGGIGYEPRSDGGARFWVRLRTTGTSSRQHERIEGSGSDGKADARR
jgi:signal transduction histidine kinase